MKPCNKSHNYPQPPNVQLDRSPPERSPDLRSGTYPCDSRSRLAPASPCCRYFSRSISTKPRTFRLATRLAPAQGPRDSTSRSTPWMGGFEARSFSRLRWSFCSTKSTSGDSSLDSGSSIFGAFWVWSVVEVVVDRDRFCSLWRCFSTTLPRT